MACNEMTDLLDIDLELKLCDQLYDRHMHPVTRGILCEVQADLMARRAEILKNTPKPPQSRRNRAG